MKADEARKMLVVYYSVNGATERVAKDVAAMFDADIDRVFEEKDRRSFSGHLMASIDAWFNSRPGIKPMQSDPYDYDLVILGTPVWWFKMAPAIRAYIHQYRERFREIACFTTSAATKPEKIVPRMEQAVGKKALGFTGFTRRELKDDARYRRRLRNLDIGS